MPATAPPITNEEKKKDALPSGLITTYINNEWYSLDFIRLFAALEHLYFVEYISLYSIDKGLLGNSLAIPEYYLTRIDFGSLPVRPAVNDDELFDYCRKHFLQINIATSHGIIDLHASTFGLVSRLSIKKIRYASPGKIDFLGIGEFIKAVFSIIKYYLPNKEDKLKRTLIEEEILEKKIANWKRAGLDKAQIKKLAYLHFANVFYLASLNSSDPMKGKITDIEYKDIFSEETE